MEYYDLFMEGPSVYIPVLVISLLITVAVYCAFPLLYAWLCRKPITARKYRVHCFLVNFLIMLVFKLITAGSSASPYFLWTTVFTYSGVKNLKSRGILLDPKTKEYAGKYAQNIEQESDVIVDTALASGRLLPEITPAKPKKTKNRFCKLCGSPIDPATKKCIGCGKQYFRMTVLKKRGIIPKVVTVLSILILGLCVYRNVQYQKQITQMTTQIAEQNEVLKSLRSELESAKSDVSEIQDKYRAKFSEAYNLSQENDEMKRIYDYCEKNMVFVISKTYLYHKPHCFMIQGSEASFEGFTVSVAQQRGYTPCWLCCN